ncbi:hypothetical protein [uncultured Zobellia sp.]|uniref:hypothetical protein n=1 Tax=uncultured Zobellia sp. TaxID=255433 RepID=UPI00259172A1|nr:hypothetical protein [uncultured Zobellia sp.]
MRNSNNGVDIQGMGNTIDLEKVMNLYTSSFTEGFIKVMENYNTPLQEFQKLEKVTSSVNKKRPKSKNIGFDKLKNPLLRDKLESCESVTFNPKSHVRVRDLRYKSIYDLDSLSKKKWVEYFSKGKVYIDQNITSSKISQRILFDKSIMKFFGKKVSPNQ